MKKGREGKKEGEWGMRIVHSNEQRGDWRRRERGEGGMNICKRYMQFYSNSISFYTSGEK